MTDKLTHISDRIYCCRSGSAADTQAVADIVTYYLSMFSVQHDTQPNVDTAAHLFSEMIYQNKDRLSAGIIVAGWDKHSGGSVWNVPLGGGVFKQPWAIGGSGSAYIYGFCDSTWKEGFSREQTLEFVRNGRYPVNGFHDHPYIFAHPLLPLHRTALSLAMSRDGSSGGTIRMADISEKGVERFFVPGDQLPQLSAKIV